MRRARRWRVWSMATVATTVLVIGVALGHGVLIAAGLVLLATAGLGVPERRPGTWFSPSRMGADTDGSDQHFQRESTVTTVACGMRREQSGMNITHTTVPGTGKLTHLVTRGGQRFAVLVTDDRRQLLVYEPDIDPDVPVQAIDLDADEAVEVAAILHDRSLVERVDALERAVAAVARERR